MTPSTAIRPVLEPDPTALEFEGFRGPELWAWDPSGHLWIADLGPQLTPTAIAKNPGLRAALRREGLDDGGDMLPTSLRLALWTARGSLEWTHGPVAGIPCIVRDVPGCVR